MNRFLKNSIDSIIEPFRKPCIDLIESDAFKMSPASLSKHHCWTGGLLDHTVEVLRLVQGVRNVQSSSRRFAQMTLDLDVITVAVIFHDAGKVSDYALTNTQKRGLKWTPTTHYKQIHHVVRSAMMWEEAFAGVLATTNFDRLVLKGKHEHISHCILAHHGQLEWGSPVTPQTKEAWAVHLADMQSVHCIEERAEAKCAS